LSVSNAWDSRPPYCYRATADRERLVLCGLTGSNRPFGEVRWRDPANSELTFSASAESAAGSAHPIDCSAHSVRGEKLSLTPIPNSPQREPIVRTTGPQHTYAVRCSRTRVSARCWGPLPPTYDALACTACDTPFMNKRTCKFVGCVLGQIAANFSCIPPTPDMDTVRFCTSLSRPSIRKTAACVVH